MCGEAGNAISKLCDGQATKRFVGGSTWDAVVQQVKPAVNEKRTVTLCGVL